MMATLFPMLTVSSVMVVMVMVVTVLSGISPRIWPRYNTTRVHFWLKRGMMMAIVTSTTMPATYVSWRGHFDTKLLTNSTCRTVGNLRMRCNLPVAELGNIH